MTAEMNELDAQLTQAGYQRHRDENSWVRTLDVNGHKRFFKKAMLDNRTFVLIMTVDESRGKAWVNAYQHKEQVAYVEFK